MLTQIHERGRQQYRRTPCRRAALTLASHATTATMAALAICVESIDARDCRLVVILGLLASALTIWPNDQRSPAGDRSLPSRY